MGYTPFDAGFGGFQFEDPMEEERKRRELEEAEATSLRQAMDTEPSWEDPVQDVGGRLPDVEPSKSTEGSLDDNATIAQAAAEGDQDYITRFEENLANRPEREDYEPGTLRKILSVIGGTLAGGDPNVTRSLAGYGEYDEDMADWEAEQSGLGDVAGLREAQVREEGLGEGRRVTERGSKRAAATAAIGHELEGGRLELGEAELAEKKRAAGVAEPLEERGMKVEERGAATGESRAASYGRSVDALADYRGRMPAGGAPQEVSPTQQSALEQLALDDVINMNPEWEKFARFHETTGDVVGRAGEVPGTDEGFLWFDKPSPVADDPDYQEFMIAFEAARRRRAETAGVRDYPALPQE